MSNVHVPYDFSCVKEMIGSRNTVIVLLMESKGEVPKRLLDMVAQVDPECARTVGVFTWLEIDTPKNCMQAIMVNELKLPFKLVGYSSHHGWLKERALYSNLPWGLIGVDAVITLIGSVVDRLFSQSMNSVHYNYSKQLRID